MFNPDTADTTELRAYYQRANRATSALCERLDAMGHDDDDDDDVERVLYALKNVSLWLRYLSESIRARRAKRARCIDLVLYHENNCEQIYNQLPARMRW